jgi:tetratricopeptide (TPR) repeat protein
MSTANGSPEKSRRKWKVILIVVAGIAALLYIFSTTFKTPEIKGVVLDAETGQPMADASIYAKWERKMRGFGGESSGGIDKVLHLKTRADGTFLIPAHTLFNFIPSPIGIKGFFYMIIYAHGYKLKSFVFYDEASFGHPKSYEEFKKLKESKGLILRLEEIKDPETFDKNLSEYYSGYLFYRYYKSKEDLMYELIEYQTFIDRFPSDKRVPSYILGKGSVYEKMKKFKEAAKEYQKVIEKYPNSKAAIEASKDIERLRNWRQL